MRYLATAAALLVAAASICAEEPAKATRVIDGMKTTFPDKTIRDGVKMLTDVLEACHYIAGSRFENGKEIKYSAEDVKNAQKGDHVRFVFARPIDITVLGNDFEVSEVVFANGAFWLVYDKNVVRCIKYEYEKMKKFEDWYRQT